MAEVERETEEMKMEVQVATGDVWQCFMVVCLLLMIPTSWQKRRSRETTDCREICSSDKRQINSSVERKWMMNG